MVLSMKEACFQTISFQFNVRTQISAVQTQRGLRKALHLMRAPLLVFTGVCLCLALSTSSHTLYTPGL